MNNLFKMRPFRIFALIIIFLLSVNGSCEKQGHPFYIINSSDQEIIVCFGYEEFTRDNTYMGGYKGLEYRDFIFDHMISPHSYKDFYGIGGYLFDHIQESTFVAVFNRSDVDTMSQDVFYETFPLKKQWEVTFESMESCNWTLVYKPEKESI